MEEIKLEHITLSLYSESNNVNVKSKYANVILSNQNIEDVTNLIINNFHVVYSHYKSRVAYNSDILIDINVISVFIVLHYLYMYNTWRHTYKGKENIKLGFDNNDFNNPTTLDIIINYYKEKYPNNWIEKCNILLEMSEEELYDYYKKRADFYNK